MAGTVIQVPIDHSLRAALDRLARERGTSRAEIIRQACLHYIREQAERSDEARYIEGYRRQPEEPALADVQAGLAAAVLADERW
ncbi:MAG: ribbon-helix-helix protein, CopG family [Chloroflexi bacterium]|nr:ribbon-helix-helix protein, CopG family [Chloroflexota bacterium]